MPPRPAPPPRPRPDARLLAAVFAGGALGTLARALLADALPHDAGAWPWATLAANVAGALLLGAAVVRLRGGTGPMAFAGPGLCGGLTTFSTFQLELFRMLDAGHVALAAGYGAASVAAGLSAAALGGRLARLGGAGAGPPRSGAAPLGDEATAR